MLWRSKGVMSGPVGGEWDRIRRSGPAVRQVDGHSGRTAGDGNTRSQAATAARGADAHLVGGQPRLEEARPEAEGGHAGAGVGLEIAIGDPADGADHHAGGQHGLQRRDPAAPSAEPGEDP